MNNSAKLFQGSFKLFLGFRLGVSGVFYPIDKDIAFMNTHLFHSTVICLGTSPKEGEQQNSHQNQLNRR